MIQIVSKNYGNIDILDFKSLDSKRIFDKQKVYSFFNFILRGGGGLFANFLNNIKIKTYTIFRFLMMLKKIRPIPLIFTKIIIRLIYSSHFRETKCFLHNLNFRHDFFIFFYSYYLIIRKKEIHFSCIYHQYLQYIIL